jgi:hypothetical protein
MKFQPNTFITLSAKPTYTVLLPSIIQTPIIIYYDEQYNKQLYFTKKIIQNKHIFNKQTNKQINK